MIDKANKKTTKADEKVAGKLSELRAQAMKDCAREVDAILMKHECVAVGIPGYVPDGTGGWRLLVRVEIHSKQ